jgi:hypothetical protein
VLVGSRAGGFHSRTIEVLDQRVVADRFLAKAQVAQVATFGTTVLDMSDSRRVIRIRWGYGRTRSSGSWGWELPVLGVVNAPTAVLVRPDSYVRLDRGRKQRGTHRRTGHLVRTADSGVEPGPDLEPEWVPCLRKATELSPQVVDGATVV